MIERSSLAGRLVLSLGLVFVAALVLSLWLSFQLPYWPVLLPVVILIALLAVVGVVKWQLRPVRAVLQSLRHGVASFADQDYSVSIAYPRQDELGRLVSAYNELTGSLREERFNIFQRELLLDTVIQSSASAVIITNYNDRVVFANRTAAGFLMADGPLEGADLQQVAAACSAELADIVAQRQDGLFGLRHQAEGQDDQQEFYHLSFRRFHLNGRLHHLYLFKQLTREITRQEVNTWKKVIRLISHELNNSLAPISSLTRSARRMLSQAEEGGVVDSVRLDDLLHSVGNRAEHLHKFIEQYASFARLPDPRIRQVPWQAFYDGLRALAPVELVEELPSTPGTFDPVQMEQVMINLIKNAREADPERVPRLRILQNDRESLLAVEDRGPGMSSEQVALALLPFYSTKRSGTGLGLPLSREIVESHGGRFSLRNQPGGGLAAVCKLPLVPQTPAETAD